MTGGAALEALELIRGAVEPCSWDAVGVMRRIEAALDSAGITIEYATQVRDLQTNERTYRLALEAIGQAITHATVTAETVR